METIELLKTLTSTVGVAGMEENIVNLLTDILKPFGKVYSDHMNNVYCSLNDEKKKKIMLDAHLDEIGLVVTSISNDGFIKVDKCGGIDRRMLLGYEVSVWGKRELFGVISNLPPHLLTDDDSKKVPDFKDIAIDVGMSKNEIEKVVSLGDRVTFKRNFTKLLNNNISANALDDRSGVASIILALEKLKNENINCNVIAMFSSQEELGTRGAKIGPFGKNIDEAISLDVSFAYSNGCDKNSTSVLGNGPMIGFSPILNKKMTKTLVSVAEKNKIPYQKEIMSGNTGTNADVISLSETGIKTALISIPERYMHSPVEMVNILDVENTAELLFKYVLDFAERSAE